MVILTVAVVLVAALALLTLLITLGLVKRLRVHADHLTTLLANQGRGPETVGVPLGTPIAPFTAITVDGLKVASAPGMLLGFFSTTCSTCAESLPGFLTYAEPLGRERVVAMVSGHEPALTDLTEKLSTVAQVVIEAEDGPVARAVGVSATPTLVVLDNNLRVASTGYQAAQLTA